MDYLQTGVYVPVPIVHAGSKSMVYVCESACFTCVHLARDDIAVGENDYISLYSNGKERSEILLKHRCYVACPSSPTELEPRHSATASDYYTNGTLLYKADVGEHIF